ncbi:hypothetical protein AB1Y20_011201 [Prymnesium parvum]|uniref:Cilia- and flagella-associated protein 43 n=1 Tax=Prymnesium parvum TaxID=97485 RepID=A0AB34INV8_PRYPA
MVLSVPPLLVELGQDSRTMTRQALAAWQVELWCVAQRLREQGEPAADARWMGTVEQLSSVIGGSVVVGGDGEAPDVVPLSSVDTPTVKGVPTDPLVRLEGAPSLSGRYAPLSVVIGTSLGIWPAVISVAKREISGDVNRSFKRKCARERFGSFRLFAEHDTHDPDAANLKLSFLRRRSKIVEIVSAGEVVFALTLSGVCVAFCGRKRLAFLNTTPDEVIRSLFFNKANNSLITVSVYREDNFSSLKCRNTPLEYIRRGKPDAGFPLFESESLKWPGFVEFDDVNSKVLTYSAKDKAYRVWEMTNYELLYTLPDDDVTEIKISPGIMLLIHQRQGGHVPLKIISIEDGSTLKEFNHLLHRSKKIDFIEQFNEKLLVKQEGENLQIVDVHTSAVINIAQTKFATPSAFIFLYENQLFLTFRQRQVTVWNFRGEQVTHFEDHVLWHPDTNTSNIFITAAQDYIISYCRTESSSEGLPTGTINISNIHTGKCVARIPGDLDSKLMQDITSIFFNEERNELYVGSRTGILHVWSH